MAPLPNRISIPLPPTNAGTISFQNSLPSSSYPHHSRPTSHTSSPSTPSLPSNSATPTMRGSASRFSSASASSNSRNWRKTLLSLGAKPSWRGRGRTRNIRSSWPNCAAASRPPLRIAPTNWKRWPLTMRPKRKPCDKSRSCSLIRRWQKSKRPYRPSSTARRSSRKERSPN